MGPDETKCSGANSVELSTACLIQEAKTDLWPCADAVRRSSISPGHLEDVSASGLAQVLGASPVPVLVDFWAPWCQPSRAAVAIVDQLAREHAGTLITLMLNTEQEPAPAVVHGVRGILTAEGLGGIPTFIIFRAGREVARRSGMLPRPQFSGWLDSAEQGASLASSPL